MNPVVAPTDAPASPRFLANRSGWHVHLRNCAVRGVGRLGSWLRLVGGNRAQGSLGILTYHRVYPELPGLPHLLHNVSPERFREQILGLKRRGFHFLSLADAIAAATAGKFPERAVVLTFDDGYQNVLTRALPVLQEADVPATVFVNTGYLNAAAPLPFDGWGCRHSSQSPPEAWRPLTRAECHELKASGLVTIGAHTHTHQDFRGRALDFQIDAQRSVDLVREWFGEQEVPFAFPYGSTRDGLAGGELKAAAIRTGASCALTTDTSHIQPNSDPFCWGRFNVFSWDTSATLAGKLEGYFTWAPELWRAMNRRCCTTAITSSSVNAARSQHPTPIES